MSRVHSIFSAPFTQLFEVSRRFTLVFNQPWLLPKAFMFKDFRRKENNVEEEEEDEESNHGDQITDGEMEMERERGREEGREGEREGGVQKILDRKVAEYTLLFLVFDTSPGEIKYDRQAYQVPLRISSVSFIYLHAFFVRANNTKIVIFASIVIAYLKTILRSRHTPVRRNSVPSSHQ